MSSQEPHPFSSGQPAHARRARRGRSVIRALANTVTMLVIGALLGLFAGFLWFVSALPSKEIVLDRSADGIVALTGGNSRIVDAIELLAQGRGKRLLISGVHRTTTLREIARVAPQFERYILCCTDLDHSALNTVGNAAETRRWARQQNFRSLIIVTSSYHMPRSMAELSRQLPDIELIPYPVVSEKLRTEPWWSHPPTARLLISEYLKYMVVQVRIRLEPAPDTTDVARGRDGARS